MSYQKVNKAAILFFSFVFLAGCTNSTLVRHSRPALGTLVEITVADKDKPRRVVDSAVNKAFLEIERVEGLFSRLEPQSDIARINACGSIHPAEVSSETMGLIEKSILFSRITGGAFDITLYPLIELWGLNRKGKHCAPGLEQLKQALNKVGYENIRIDREGRFISFAQPGMSLDLGAIAKGYSVDRAVGVLKQQGIANALVNAGGDIYALGMRDKGRPWSIAVQHPRNTGAILTRLELKNRAVATSGDYQKYIELDGERYSHIIDPRSGYPCQDVPASVTVLAEDCTSADALATSIFVLGPQKGIDLVEQLEDTEAIVVNLRDGKLDIGFSSGAAANNK